MFLISKYMQLVEKRVFSLSLAGCSEIDTVFSLSLAGCTETRAPKGRKARDRREPKKTS